MFDKIIEYTKNKFGVNKKMLEHSAVKDWVYGGIIELMNNPKYYRKSGVDSRYSYWTEEGKVVLIEFMFKVCQSIEEAERDKLMKLAKQLVMNGLKGED